MRARAKVLTGALILLAAVFVGGVLSFGPLVRWRMRAEVAARGGEVSSAGRVRPGFGRVWVHEVALRIPDVPTAEARFDVLEVELSPTLRPRRVAVHGGRVLLRGSADDLARDMRVWREKRGGPAGAGGRVQRPEIEACGVGLEWMAPSGPGSAAHLWGIHALIRGGVLEASADLARIAGRGLAVDARRPGVLLRHESGRTLVDRVEAEYVGATLDLGVGEAPATSGPAQKEPPRGRGLLAALASVPGATRGARLRSRLHEVARLFERSLPVGANLTMDQLYLGVRHRGQLLEIGPAQMRVARDANAVRAALAPREDGRGAPLRCGLTLPFHAGPVELEMAGGPTTLSALGVDEGSFGLLDVGRSELRVDAVLRLSEDGALLEGDGLAELAHLSLQNGALSREPLRDARLRWNGKWKVSLDGSLVDLKQGVLTVGTVPVELAANVERRGLTTRGKVDLRVPLASCQAMLEAAPRGLLPLLTGARMDGTFALDAGVEFDSARPRATKVRWQMAQDCRPVTLPPAIDPERFKSSWTRDVVGADRQRLTLTSGPGTPGWVPLRAISKHVETAVLVCEDGRFFRHRGFDNEAIANSIRENINSGKFVRGASTISMQLAKNLYLPREKTLARKLQEAVLTAVLERSLSKDELMELYLNVIEFGPGIYGIGPAAAFYFESSAADLSLGQALYLASILPNPWQQHFDASGAVSAGWSSYLQKLMQIARKIGRIDDPELEEGLAERVVFKTPYGQRTGDEGAAPPEEGPSWLTPASAMEDAGP